MAPASLGTLPQTPRHIIQPPHLAPNYRTQPWQGTPAKVYLYIHINVGFKTNPNSISKESKCKYLNLDLGIAI